MSSLCGHTSSWTRLEVTHDGPQLLLANFVPRVN
uniref:Uncharacterized protein n=1 Tax=Heterorhabditis bacteriophora TaxID=37862 RepID=A0A1I7XGC1_HETBA